MPEWVSLAQATKELGLSRDTLKSKIHNGYLPYRMAGSHFMLNLELVREYLKKEDIENMERLKYELSLNPFSKKKANVRRIAE